MTPDRDEVLRVVNAVPEPCSIKMHAPMDIGAMGLVEEVRIEGGDVRVELVLTDPSCVHFASMRRFIGDALAEVDGVESVEVVISTTRLWMPDRARRQGATA